MGKAHTKKRSWRKANLKDVEDALEDERLVDRMKNKNKKGKGAKGGDDELFTVDTKGSGEGLSKKDRRELARAKLFPPKAPKLGLSAYEEHKVDRARGALDARGKNKRKAEPDVFDLWEPVDPAKAKAAEPEFKAIRTRTVHTPLKKPWTLGKRTSLAPAVVPADEGQSMNPESKAFEDLTFRAAAEQLEKEREAEELKRKMAPMTAELRDVLGEEAIKDLDGEAMAKLYRETIIKRGLEEGEEAAGPGANPAVKNKKKSQSFRNKERKRLKEDFQKAQARAQKKLEKSVGEVGALAKEMAAKASLHQERREYKAKLKQERLELEATKGIVPKRRRIGRTSFVEDALVLPDVEAAKSGLRATPLKASALQERVSSILRRGMLPAPPEANRSEAIRQRKRNDRAKRARKYMSPLLRENLLLK